jgi:hypothetical protein
MLNETCDIVDCQTHNDVTVVGMLAEERDPDVHADCTLVSICLAFSIEAFCPNRVHTLQSHNSM